MTLIQVLKFLFAACLPFPADDQNERPSSHHQSYKPPQPPVRRHDDRPSSHHQSYEPPQSPVRRHDERQHQQVIDSSQGNLTPVEAHTSFRARARREGDLMVQYKRQSQEAYKRRDHARAKALSDEARRHGLKMERLDAEASAAIFKGKPNPYFCIGNELISTLRKQPGKVPGRDVAPLLHSYQDRAACEIDLHGLYVKEAIAYSQRAVADARQRDDSEIRLIVGMCVASARFEPFISSSLAGQGNHSEGGISRLRPAIEKDMQM